MCISRTFINAAFHEVTHAYGAVHGRGYIFGEVTNSRLLEEFFVAFATEQAYALKPNLNIQSADPKKYKGAYPLEHKLMSVLSTCGPRAIGIASYADGFYESATRLERARCSLFKKLDTATQELLPEFSDGWIELSSSYENRQLTDRDGFLQHCIDTALWNAGIQNTQTPSTTAIRPQVRIAADR